MTYAWPAKFGDEVLDYEWDWTARLEEGETITDVAATAAGNTALEVENVSTSEGVTAIWVSGGGERANKSGRINLLATTSKARTIGEQISLPVKAR